MRGPGGGRPHQSSREARTDTDRAGPSPGPPLGRGRPAPTAPQGAGAAVDRGLEAVSAPDGAGGLQREEGTPSDGGGTQGLTASVLHVHSFLSLPLG